MNMPVLNQEKVNRKVDVLGCSVTKLSIEDFVGLAEQFISSGKPHYIAVANAAKIVKMRSDKELKSSIQSAHLVGADGVPLIWAARLLGKPLLGRVNGTDLMYRLLERADEKRYRIFFFGTKEKILQKVIERVRTEYPSVNIAGFHHGYFTPAQELLIVRKIRAAKADILFIAFGTPKKELWIKRYLSSMGVPVVHGVGGSFDVLAGVIPRAPLWMQKYGLEWLFRLGQEPRRMWRRYLVTNTLFILLILKAWLCYRIGLLVPNMKL
jgi:N-acetylglucosaminyldiphosphoundecaprenol N-acetyl-beta-D-mannosaminyltransferase